MREGRGGGGGKVLRLIWGGEEKGGEGDGGFVFFFTNLIELSAEVDKISPVDNEVIHNNWSVCASTVSIL